MTGVKGWSQSCGLNMRGIRSLSILQLYAVSYPSWITHKSVTKLLDYFWLIFTGNLIKCLNLAFKVMMII